MAEPKEKKFYSKAELEEFREIIDKKLKDAREEVKDLQVSLQNTNEASSDGSNISDFGSESSDKEQIEMFLSRQRKFIDQLEKALIRIKNGTYGRCKETGKLIAKERLRLVPHTQSSLAAKLGQNKGRR